MTILLDRAEEFEKLCEGRREQKKSISVPANSFMESSEAAIRGDGKYEEVAMVGRCEGVPDPEVPEPAAPPTPEPPK
jgi:hypothetical protein